MIALLAESVLMVRASWPRLFCPGDEDGVHDLEFDLGTYVCRYCDAAIWCDEARAVSRLWRRMARAMDERRN